MVNENISMVMEMTPVSKQLEQGCLFYRQGNPNPAGDMNTDRAMEPGQSGGGPPQSRTLAR